MRRIVVTLPAIALAALASTTTAQPPTGSPCPYEQCAVRTEISVFNEYLVRGDSAEKVVKINFTGSNAASYLSRSQAAIPAARQFQTSRTRGAVLGILGGLAVGYATGALAARGRDRLETSEIIALSVGIPVAIWGGVESARSRNALSRAIMEFNRAPVR